MFRASLTFVAFSLASTGAALAQQGLANFVDRPRQAPLTETEFGVETQDPYRWMETDHDAVSAWVRAASEHTVAELHALPGREALANRLRDIATAGIVYRGVRGAGDRLFLLRLDPDSSTPKLIVRERNGSERVLFDPATAGGSLLAINNFMPSPSGRRIAFHVAEGGGEVGTMRFMDVATGAFLADALAPIWGEIPVSWIDEDTVLYTRMADPPGEDPIQGMNLRRHRLGDSASEDSVLIAPGAVVQAYEIPAAGDSPVSDWTSGFAAGARADLRPLFAQDADIRAGQASWIAPADYDDRISAFDVRGDYAYLLTTKTAPNGEIIRLDLRNPSLAAAETVLPAGELVLTNIITARDGVYVIGQRDGVSRLLFLRNGRGAAQPVALPFDGSMYDFSQSPDGAGVSFAMSGWLENMSYYEARGGHVRPLDVAAPNYEGVSAFSVINDEAVSVDGARVPLTILAPRDAPRNGANPTILYAYGSYGAVEAPGYSPYIYGWLEQGGLYAFCHTRGGGARGRDWHEGGRSANKPNAQADYIACAERLIELGYTSPAHLGGMSASAGGLLVPIAALKRPDLFAAIAMRVAVLNATRLGAGTNGATNFAEMGDPNTEDGYRALYEQDAYHWLMRASGSPNWLLTVGLNDHRVEPWESAKFAARALERFGDHRLVLLRADAEAGHGVGSTRNQVVEERADIFAFFLNRFGVAAFQAAN